MSFLESDDGWLGLWSEDSTGLDIQDSSFHHMSGASTDMTEIPENLLPFGFSMLLASTVSTCLLRLLKLPTWLLIFTKVSIRRDQTRSFQASSDPRTLAPTPVSRSRVDLSVQTECDASATMEPARQVEGPWGSDIRHCTLSPLSLYRWETEVQRGGVTCPRSLS